MARPGYPKPMEEHIADLLLASGHDLRRLFAARARIVYRKPSFRGEPYRRAVWFCSEAPLALAARPSQPEVRHPRRPR